MQRVCAAVGMTEGTVTSRPELSLPARPEALPALPPLGPTTARVQHRACP